MDRYLVETPHTASECLDLIKLINAQGYLWNFDWGCEAGIHSGWAIINAENEGQARLAVPPLVRSRARIVRLNKFDATTIKKYEKQQAAAARSGGRVNDCKRDHRRTHPPRKSSSPISMTANTLRKVGEGWGARRPGT